MKTLVTLVLLLSGAVSNLQAQVPDLMDWKPELVNATVRPVEILIEAGTKQSRPQSAPVSISSPQKAEAVARPGGVVKTSIKVKKQQEDPEPPPPPRHDPELSEKVITSLILEMQLVLSRLETLIRERGILLLLVFDLDDTLFQRSSQFGPEIESFTLSQLKDLQQIWFMQLHDFLNNNSDSVRLVYNTSRDSISLPSKHPLRQEWCPIHWVTSADGVTRRMMSFLSQADSADQPGMRFRVGIPIPDALITGTGRLIQVSDELQSSPPSQYWVNESIRRWLIEDEGKMEEASGYLKYHFTSRQLSSAPALMTLINKEGFAEKSRTVPVPSTFDQATITLTDAYELEAFFYIQNVSVNKGTSLRILLNRSRIIDTDKTVIGVVYGDTVTDLSMLRPDLEIKATVPVPVSILAKRNARLETIGVPSDIKLFSRLWWNFSVVPSKGPFNSSKNQRVRKSVESEKVLEAKTKGLLGLLKVTLGQLSSHRVSEL